MAYADVAVSARTGAGIDRLLALLEERAQALLPGESEAAFNSRQETAAAVALGQLDRAAQETDLLLLAESLRLTRLELDRITGQAGVEDMLDALFGRFCIGK